MARNRKSIDYTLLAITFLLIALGLLLLAGITAPLFQRNFGNPYHFLIHQIVFGLVPGMVLGIAAFKVSKSYLEKKAPIFLLIILVLMIMVFLPHIGTSAGGATRWISFGSFSFQPSEFLKPAFFLYLASWLSAKTKAKKIKTGLREGLNKNLIVFLVIIGLIGLFLIAQPDLSTLAIILCVALVMYFGAKTPWWHSVLAVSLTVGALIILINTSSYRMERLLVFLKPNIDPMGRGYQISQSLIAIGSGGVWGLGLGLSRQKFGFLPGSMTDSVFAIFCEETGLIGSISLVLLFIAFLWRGFTIAKESGNQFSKLCALGITAWIVVQGFVNISSMIRLLPITGIPLPFISYGGSALISELIGVGILLNISKKNT